MGFSFSNKLFGGTGSGSSLPTLTGNTGKVLTVNAGETGTEWAVGPAPAAAGSDTQVLFNDGGAIAGNAGFTFTKASAAVGITGPLTLTPTADIVPATFRAYSSGTNYIQQNQTSANAVLSGWTHAGEPFLLAGKGAGKVLTSDANGVGTWAATVALANGGTGADLSTIAKGGIVTGTGAGTVGITTVGVDGTFLKANSGAAGGVEWAAGGGGGVTNSAGANVLAKSDGTNLVASSVTDDGTLVTINTATKARATILTDGTGPALGVTATLPASPSAQVAGLSVSATGAGTAAQMQAATQSILNAGYTGAKPTYGLYAQNISLGTGNRITGGYGTFTGNVGVYGITSLGNPSGASIGVVGQGSSSGTGANVGVIGYGAHTSAGVAIGVLGTASSATGVGGYFGLNTASDPTVVNAALITDNAAVAAPIFLARDNGVVKVSIEDGGALCGNYSKTLTESSATGFVEIAVASNQVASAIIDYEIEANDGTDFQTLVGSVYVSGVNKGGTVTATVGEVGTPINAVSAGTLTNTMTVTAGTGKFTVNANAVSSLTQTTLRIKYLIRAPKPVTATSL
jgi:hypothetical protein